MRQLMLIVCATLILGGGTAPAAPPTGTGAQPTAAEAQPTTVSRPRPFRPTAAQVIAKAGPRTSFGAVSGGRTLLAWSAGYGPVDDKKFWSAYRIMDGDRVVSERLVDAEPAPDYLVTVEPMPGGFLVAGYGMSPRFVSASGTRSRLRMTSRPTRLRSGDVAVGIDGWLYRSKTRTVHSAVRAPGGTFAGHVDGSGSWWSLGAIESGQQVLWSRRPGQTWVKHLAGPQVPYTPACTCPWGPAIHGRGPVVVASMGPLNHVSLDHGATWQTYDLSASEPFQTVYSRLREPMTSALDDGRIVTGYLSYWVADDPSNTSFRSTGLRSLHMWRAGLSSAPVRRGDAVSLDGGLTWVPLDPRAHPRTRR